MDGKGMNGKGDKQRPGDRKAYADGWVRIFGKKKGGRKCANPGTS